MFSLDQVTNQVVVVNCMDIMKDILNGTAFLCRRSANDPLIPSLKEIRGGHGLHGIIFAGGEEWREQRRFALQKLKDFGFGKQSLEAVVRDEVLELCKTIEDQIRGGNNDINVATPINITVVNVLWKVVGLPPFGKK